MPKTGTTALQMRMSASRTQLLKKRILYPATTSGKAQHFLSLPLDFENTGQRLLVQRIGRDNVKAQSVFASSWANLVDEIAKHEPEDVIMSSEYLYSRLRGKDGDLLAKQLQRTFRDIQVVAYVRQPSKYLASACLQGVKFSGTVVKPRPITWKRHLNEWEKRFPGNVTVRVYDRALLRENDISEDFIFHALSREDVDLAAFVRANESMSAEAGLLMQEFQVEHQAGLDNQTTPEKARMRRRLMKLEKRIPTQGSPRLRAEIAQYVDEGSIELLWLRDEHGIQFPGIDYEQIRKLPAPEGKLDSIQDIFEIDQVRLEDLRKKMQPGFSPPIAGGFLSRWRG